MLFSTHHPEQAFACASQVALLQGGALARIGPPEAAITPETLKLLYGVDVDIVGVGAAMKACVPRGLR
jgi:iron complex transport system ATP-binding protein